MKFFRYIFLLIFSNWIVIDAQFSDSFTDNNYTENPAWFGDTSEFVINTELSLQLNNPNHSGKSHLATKSASILNATWEFIVKFYFNPSSSNYADVYLVSDNENLLGLINGYFVRIGNTTDEVSLYRNDGNITFELIDGKDHITSTDSLKVRIKITRDSIGFWELYTDTLLNGNYFFEGSCFDPTYYSGRYFGIVCEYTKTRSDKFVFDDFIVTGEPFIDSIKPRIEAFRILSDSSLWLQYSEPVINSLAYNTNNYILNKLNNNPLSIIVDEFNSNAYILFFDTKFESGRHHLLTIREIEDIHSNQIKDTLLDFIYYYPTFGDIVINEIMADPSPSVGLPEQEFIELYNKSDFPISLENWIIQIAGNQYTITNHQIYPGDYAILVSSQAAKSYTSHTNIIEISDFPALNNSGTLLELYDRDTNLIHFLNYTNDWHSSIFKKDGGWSLELIDPLNPCGKTDNWSSSISLTGGTPGKINSIYADNPDLFSPELERIGVIDEFTIRLFFDESIFPLVNESHEIFDIDNGIGNPIMVNLNPITFSTIDLTFSIPIQPHIKYTISISNRLMDCAGNELSETSNYQFMMPEHPELNDIIINEILFNPIIDEYDFVELYNRSNKVIDLNKLYIASKDTYTSEIKSYNIISSESFLFYPGKYYILTEDPENIKQLYYTQNPKNFIEIDNLPDMPDKEGRIAIFDSYENTIDDFTYHEDMHYDLLNSIEGVALERINPDISSNDRNNWHSAAETVGYATPAYQNSHYSETTITDQSITIKNEVFSPDNDGHEDILEINYNINNPGNVCTMAIYDTKGRLVKTIADNMLIDAMGIFTWDGTTNKGQIAEMGVYIIYTRLFDTNGNVEKFKHTCILAKKIYN